MRLLPILPFLPLLVALPACELDRDEPIAPTKTESAEQRTGDVAQSTSEAKEAAAEAKRAARRAEEAADSMKTAEVAPRVAADDHGASTDEPARTKTPSSRDEAPVASDPKSLSEQPRTGSNRSQDTDEPAKKITDESRASSDVVDEEATGKKATGKKATGKKAAAEKDADNKVAEDDARQPVAGTDRQGETATRSRFTLSFDGPVTQGGIVVVKAAPGTRRAMLGGDKLRVAADGTFLVGFAYDAPEQRTLAIVGADGQSRRHVFDIEQRTFREVTIDGLPDDEVMPESAKEKGELASAQKRVEEARSVFSEEAHYRRGISWPAKGRITSTYGVMREFNGELKSRHWGVDIAVPVGTPAEAPGAGIVRFAEQDVPLAGGLVIIDHGHGLSSSLLHLSELDVKVGDRVEKGEVVARSGKTGRTTGPHLDWRMNLFQLPIDPQLVVGITFEDGRPHP